MTNNAADERLDAELTALHDAYLQQVNAAVSAGREALAWSLEQDFREEADELLERGRA